MYRRIIQHKTLLGAAGMARKGPSRIAFARFATGHTHRRVAIADPSEQECWKCGTCVNVSKVVCGSCDAAMAPPSTVNFFELLEMPVRFDLDPVALERSFRARQMLVHPDRHQSRGEPDREVAEEASSSLNAAYATLRRPASRAAYILKMHGREPLAEDKKVTMKVDPSLLMEVMEFREALDSALTSLEDIAAIRDDAASRVEGIEIQLAEVLDVDDARPGHATIDLDKAEQLVVELQYWTKLADEAEATSAKRKQLKF